MNSLLETGNVDDAAKTVHDLKPPKRYVVHSDRCMLHTDTVLINCLRPFPGHDSYAWLFLFPKIIRNVYNCDYLLFKASRFCEIVYIFSVY